MGKRIIRLNEQDIENLVKKIIKEETISEIGGESFTNTKEIGSGGGTLRPAVAKLRGVLHVVIIDKNKNIVGYGPSTKGLSREKVCSIAQRLINDWEEEVGSLDEVESRNFEDIKPITFCSK